MQLGMRIMFGDSVQFSQSRDGAGCADQHIEAATNFDTIGAGAQDASHFICGAGDELRYINPVTNPEGNNPSPAADARAAAKGWAETKAFLARQ